MPLESAEGALSHRDDARRHCRLRVFVLGPSHHVYTRKCVLSSATHYSSPIGKTIGFT